MQDFFGHDIKIGDYIIYPMKAGRSAIKLKVAKIIGLTPKTMNVTYPHDNHKWFVKDTFKVPERCIIISEVQALLTEPMFENLE